MKWSYSITRIAGIDVRVHATFVFLLLWIAIVRWQETGSVAGVVGGIGFILLLFCCVVMHEFGHALTAQRFGIVTKDITLLPIGGVARMESMPENPRHEMLVALAGPAVNLVIALIFWPFVAAGGEALELARPLALDEDGNVNILHQLMTINLILALFNLLPAFPMDGGRVLRAALCFVMPRLRATRMAASMGQILAILLGLLGLMGNPWLIFIAMFVWIGAASEAGYAEIKSATSQVPVTRAMLTNFSTLEEHDSLAKAVDLTLSGSQKDFPVLRDDRVIGVLTGERLLTGLREAGELGVVGRYMSDDFADAASDESLEDIILRLQSSGCRLVAVYERDRFIGIVNFDNLLEWIAMSNALAGSN